MLLAGLALSGCDTTAQNGPAGTSGFASPAPAGATLAFESIEGPPRPVFDALVAAMAQEAQARSLPVVSRRGTAQFRIRGYLAARATGGHARFAYVFDIYDQDLRRAYRIDGEEAASASGRGAKDPWAAADRALIERIARAGMERVAAFLAGGAPHGPAVASVPASAPSPEVTLAKWPGTDDFSPEAAGIFRLFRGNKATAPVAEPAMAPAKTDSAAEEPAPHQRSDAATGTLPPLAYAPAAHR